MKRNEVILKTVFGIVICFLFGGLFYSIFFTNFYKKYSIKRNYQIIQGAKILKVNRAPKTYNVHIIEFVYSVENKEYRSQIRNSYSFRKGASFSGRLFPVVVDKSSISNAFIMIKPDDFSYFDLSFPDSLNWIHKDLIY
jgi:hypothetical protein